MQLTSAQRGQCDWHRARVMEEFLSKVVICTKPDQVISYHHNDLGFAL
jgi:hypothetical protein